MPASSPGCERRHDHPAGGGDLFRFASGKAGAEGQGAVVADPGEALAGQAAQHAGGKRPEAGGLPRAAKPAFPAHFARGCVDAHEGVSGLRVHQLASTLHHAGRGGHPPEGVSAPGVESGQLARELHQHRPCRRRVRAQRVRRGHPPRLAVDQLADAPVRKQRALRSGSGAGGAETAAGVRFRSPVSRFGAMAQQGLRLVAEIGGELVAARAQRLVRVELRGAGGQLGEPHRRQLQRLLPPLRAHLVARQIPAQRVRAELQRVLALAGLPGFDQALGLAEQVAQEEEDGAFPGQPRRAGPQ